MKYLIIAVASLWLTACAATTSVTPFQTHPPYTGPVTLYSSPPGDYEVVAYLEIVQSAPVNSLITTLKNEAARLGADGLLVTKEDIARLTPPHVRHVKGYAIQTR